MKTKICASVAARTIPEMREKALKALSLGADLVELRLDYLSSIDVCTVSEFMGEIRDRAVITLRPSWEGGRFVGDEEFRTRVLVELAEAGPAYVDIELGAPDLSDLSRKLRERSRLIVSKHDFNGSLTRDKASAAASKALTVGDIAKIVGTASSFSENLMILSLYREFPPEKLIAFAMGERGVISRILSALLGAPIVYACLPGEAVAPGQLTVNELKQLLELVDR